jgi:hypothetical protein
MTAEVLGIVPLMLLKLRSLKEISKENCQNYFSINIIGWTGELYKCYIYQSTNYKKIKYQSLKNKLNLTKETLKVSYNQTKCSK